MGTGAFVREDLADERPRPHCPKCDTIFTKERELRIRLPMKRPVINTLSVRLPLLFVASTVAIMGVMIPLVYQRFHDRMIDQYTRMAEGVTQLMVNAFDAEKVDEYIEHNFELPEYVETVDYLYTLRDNYPDILYMYIYRFEEDGGHVIIDLDADWWENGQGYKPGYLWSLDVIEEPYASHLSEVMRGEKIAGYSELTKEDGYLFTYTRPIFRSDGSYACTACVDFSMDYLSGKDRAFTLQLALIVLGFGAIVLVFDFRIVRRRVTHPLDKLSLCASKFAYDTEEDRSYNLQLLDALNINTGDEIESVYHTLQSVTSDSCQATANLSQALADIKERDGMITAMAQDYRTIFFIDLDKDECTCVRASTTTDTGDKCKGRVFSFQDGFADYAERYVAASDRDEFLRFVDPDNIREELAHETMISLIYLSTKDDTEQYEMLRIAGVRTIAERDDRIVHAVAAGFSDVDRQIREELEHRHALTEALARAEEANTAKTAFLSSMSHEIRTPMNAIIGLDNIALQEENIPQRTRDELEKIGASARHLLALINDILDMSRIESGRMVLKAEVFSFTEMVDQINIIINGQCEDKRLTYVSQTIGTTDENFVGDALRLRQILINILGNAVKFTDAPGTVSFVIEQTSQTGDIQNLCFTIQDSGVGMDEAFIPKLFEPFAQEDATSTNRYGGSGLGMAITKNMVDLMGGSITVKSKKGHGTTFTVTIPLQRAESVETSEVVDEGDSIVSVAGLHVLIAEDMEMNAEVLADLLEIKDVSSEWAENGQIAVDMLSQSEEHHFDAILMDMRMPVMDGLSATREIRKLDRADAKEMPIIALTANAFEEDVRACLQAGMDAHLSKPVDIDALEQTLGKLLARG